MSEPRVVRHKLADRLYHWVMAVSVLTLIFTAFPPKFGLDFDWLTIHWTAGIVLTLLVVAHIVRATIWQDFWAMMIVPRDIADGWRSLRAALSRKAPDPPKPGKYRLAQKTYHLAIAVVVLTAIVTGLLMLSKIDTPWWQRNPYWLDDHSWGVIYVLHGLAAMSVVAAIMVHIYFALRPEEFWYTKSMVWGWVARRAYLAHHDPQRWNAEAAEAEKPPAANRSVAG